MSDPVPTPHPRRSAAPRRRYRFGLRWLLLVVLLVCLACGWISCEHRRAQEQVVLVNGLTGVGILAELNEPTGVGQLVRKFVPQREAWLREQLGSGWFERPTVVGCYHLTDEQVPKAVERLARLGTVREIHLASPQLSEQGTAALRSGLPGVAVVPADRPDLQRYYRSRTVQPQFALAGVGLAAMLVAGLLGTLILFAWPLVQPRRPAGR